jgi:shikimate kinase
VVAGFSGAGKTTAGRRLADLKGARFVDLDATVDPAGGPAGAHLERAGEAAFRRAEADAFARALREALAGPGPTVIALGGGALEDERTRRLALRCARVAWLDASAATCLARARASPERRPVLERAAAAGQEVLRDLHEARTRRAADVPLRIDAEGPPEEVARRLGIAFDS